MTARRSKSCEEHPYRELFELRRAVDLAKGGECAHCGSPLSMLDVKQAEVLVAALQKAGAGPQPVDKAALPLELARARRDVSDAFARFSNQPNWFSSVEDAGTVGAAPLAHLAEL
jgi:hypothetical protein